MNSRLVGYDINGWRDLAVRNWIERPGEDECYSDARDGYKITGGVGSVVVRVSDKKRGDNQWLGGEQALLAPHGRGGGWGSVGVDNERIDVREIVRESENYTDHLKAVLHALGHNVSIGVVAIDDTGEVSERNQEAWLDSMSRVGIRQKRLLVWRPVLAVLDALEGGMLDNAKTVGVLSQTARGLATQVLVLKRSDVLAPERRRSGVLHSDCELGYEHLEQNSRTRFSSFYEAGGIDDDFSHARSIISSALGIPTGEEILRCSNGSWEIFPALAPPSLDGVGLPSSINKEFQNCDVILCETLSEGSVSQTLFGCLKKVSQVPVILLDVESVARGGLVAARRLLNREPVYFDFLPQISTIVQKKKEPCNRNLIPEDDTLPAGEVYRSVEPAEFGLPAGQKQLDVYLKKETHERPRKATVDIPFDSRHGETVRLFVEQAPAAGRARLIIESDNSYVPINVDWESAEEESQDWDDLISSLKFSSPTIPQRLVLPPTSELWEWSNQPSEDDSSGFSEPPQALLDDNSPSYGLLSMLKRADSAASPNWSELAHQLSNRIRGRYFCVSSDGELPDTLPSEAVELLDRISARALKVSLDRAKGKIHDDNNDALRFLTWLFRRCDSRIVPELIKAMESPIGGHPFVYHPNSRKLVYQGLGRILSDSDSIRHVFNHLISIPQHKWISANHVACAAFLLSRTEYGPLLLQREEVDELALIGSNVMQKTKRERTYQNLRYPPLLFVGLLRWRHNDPYALIAEEDPVADMMLKSIKDALPDFKKVLSMNPAYPRLYKVLTDVCDELKGKGNNPNILIDLF